MYLDELVDITKMCYYYMIYSWLWI